MADHPAVCALIHSRTAPTLHAVTLADNLYGFGKVPAATLRQSVGALNGRGAGMVGRLGLWTSCASRMNALSGITSNDGVAAVGFGCFTGIGAAIAGDKILGLCDISWRLLNPPDTNNMHDQLALIVSDRSTN
jgi:hypothetical protein